MPYKATPPSIRWWKKVAVQGPSDCWEWSAGRFNTGYGCFSLRKGKSVPAHRFGYELLIGPIPKGQLVCHHCDNPPCCNPAHLYLGSARDNMNDKMSRGRRHAPGPSRPPKGERNGRAKLTWDLVAEMRAQCQGISYPLIAKRYNISCTQATRIMKGECWNS